MRISTRTLSFLLVGSAVLNVGAGLYIFSRNPSRPAEPPARQELIKKEVKVKAPSSPKAISLSMLHLDPLPARLRIRRSAILNTLVDKYGYRSYLEIGQGQREQNLDWIQCPIRIGVDPEPTLNAAYKMTSDDFFAQNNDTFDLVFIDGLHHADQVERDILNALAILNDDGTIVVHDCNPLAEEYQRVPPPKNPKAWTGDVWKTWVKFRASRPDLMMYVVDIDFGCGVIRRGRQDTIRIPDPLTYAQLDSHRAEWLNLVSVQDFLARLRD
jgi:SAM-dependent methyltransferase